MKERLRAIGGAVGAQNVEGVQANALMERLMGHTVYANVFMLGHAWQQGMIPVQGAALLHAIELNGVDIQENQRAFNWGRLSALNPDYVLQAAKLPEVEVRERTLEELIAQRATLLVAYQNQAYADEYRQRRAGLLQRFHNPASLLAVQEEGAAATTRPTFLRSSGNNR